MGKRKPTLITQARRVLAYRLKRSLRLIAHEFSRLLCRYPGNSWSQNVFVIRTHVLNAPCLELYIKCVAEFGKERVFICFDETKKPLERAIGDQPPAAQLDRNKVFITVSETACRLASPLHRSAMYSAAAHVVLSARRISAPFRFLWLIEGDVYCHGSIKTCLQNTLKSSADFMAKPTGEPTQRVFRSLKNNPKWPWWKSIEGDLASAPIAQRKGCFFPIIRCSRDFIDVLGKNLESSSGYCEVYFPTLCDAYGLRLSPLPAEMFGNFHHRPPLSYAAIQMRSHDHRLYHPVKLFDSLPWEAPVK